MHAEHVCKACRCARAMYVHANGKQGAGWKTRASGQGQHERWRVRAAAEGAGGPLAACRSGWLMRRRRARERQGT
eukprot:7720967-Lingulodinium_polyedra.AAC.1